MFLFLPIIVGCPTTYKPQSHQQVPRICPNCHNGSVIAAKRTTWFELFFIPIFPMSRKNVWICHICHWNAALNAGEELPPVGYNYPPAYPMEGQAGQGWQQPGELDSQPPYTNGPQPKAR